MRPPRSGLTGMWRGEYVYGPGYGAAEGAAVQFTLHLREAGAFAFAGLARLTGHLHEDPSPVGSPEPGDVRGRRLLRRVTFVRSQQEHYSLTEADGVRPTRELLESEHGVRLPRRIPMHVRYAGRLLLDGERMGGTFRVLPTTQAIGDDLARLEGVGTGTWSARRVDQESDAP